MLLIGDVEDLAFGLLQHCPCGHSIVKGPCYNLVGGLDKGTPYAVILDYLSIVLHIRCGRHL